MRQLSKYEQNQLRKFGKSDINLETIGEQPIEYVTGRVEFCDLVFEVNPKVLIPRIETEELVADVVKTTLDLANQHQWLHTHLIDVGTGSGALGIAISHQLTQSNFEHHMTLSDVSPAALEVAKQNSQQLLPEHHQPKIVQSDLLADINPESSFQIMIANLPYIPSPRIEYLDESVQNFEPHLALDGGTDGAQLIRRFLQQAPEFLEKNGLIFLEIDHTHQLTDILPPGGILAGEIGRDQLQRRRFAKVWFAQFPPFP